MAVLRGVLLLLLAISHLDGLSAAATGSGAAVASISLAPSQASLIPSDGPKSSRVDNRQTSRTSSQRAPGRTPASLVYGASNGHILSKESAAHGTSTTQSSSSSTSKSHRPTFSISVPPKRTIFKTEPSFRPEDFDITNMTDNRALLSPGYIFLDPTFGPRVRGWGPWGPQIYDVDGNLIWHGIKGTRSQNFHVCDYLGEKGTHLCIHERVDDSRWMPASQRYNSPSGAKYVYDNTYTIVSKNYTNGVEGFGTNGHEFNDVDDGKSFLQPIEVERPMDLRVYGGRKQGWVKDVCFQEIDFKSGRKLFKWCWLDHLPIWQTSVFPNWQKATDAGNTTSIKGGQGTRNSPWDFAHINSIDKTFEGDYLMSARHCDQIVKVAGRRNVHKVKPGSVLWRLGGHGGEFEMDFSFSKQHAIRVISTGQTESIISLLSNDMAGATLRGENTVSAGQIIRVNNKTMKASLVQHYPQPFGLLTGGKGNLQLLENRNVFMGWGFLPSFSEFDHDGKLLYHAKFTARMIQQKGLKNLARYEASYRAFKAPWVGMPKDKPKLLAYSRTCFSQRESPLIAYVSWNGATEVKRWKFSTGDTEHGPWYTAGTWAKLGFETKAEISNFTNSFYSFAPYVSVEALDHHDKVLGRTKAKIFVPMNKIAARCDDDGCSPNRFRYPDTLNKIDKCTPRDSPIPVWLPLLLVIIIVEILHYLSAVDWSSVFGYSRITDVENEGAPEGEKIAMLEPAPEQDFKD